MKAYIFSKSYLWKSSVIGVVATFFLLPILSNLKVFEFLTTRDYVSVPLFLIALFLFFPALFAIGFFIVYRFTSVKDGSMSEVGKFSIIGVLNTFLSWGVFNFLIMVTNISGGWLLDLFVLVAFFVTVTHSFFWNKFWTFQINNTDKQVIEYARFFIISVIVVLFVAFLIHIIVNVIETPFGIDAKVWANIVYVLLIPVSFVGNFFGYKFFVFKKYL